MVNFQSFLAGFVVFGQDLKWLHDPYGLFMLYSQLIAFTFVCLYDLIMASLLLVRVLRVKSIRETIQTVQYRNLVLKLGSLYIFWVSIIIATLTCIFETAFNTDLSLIAITAFMDAGYLGLTFEMIVAFEFMQVIELPVKIRANPEKYFGKKGVKKNSVGNEAPVLVQEPTSALQILIQGIQLPISGSNDPVKDPERFLLDVSNDKPKSETFSEKNRRSSETNSTRSKIHDCVDNAHKTSIDKISRRKSELRENSIERAQSHHQTSSSRTKSQLESSLSKCDPLKSEKVSSQDKIKSSEDVFKERLERSRSISRRESLSNKAESAEEMIARLELSRSKMGSSTRAGSAEEVQERLDRTKCRKESLGKAENADVLFKERLERSRSVIGREPSSHRGGSAEEVMERLGGTRSKKGSSSRRKL